MDELKAACPREEIVMANGAVQLSYEGRYYRYDPRLRTATNTLASPATSMADADLGGGAESCPAAKKSFLSAGGCVLARTCSPSQNLTVAHSSQRFTLCTHDLTVLLC